MRCVVQRVESASVIAQGETTGEIGKGLLALIGVEDGDTHADIEYMVKKLSALRVFEDAQDKMNLSVKDVGGKILLVSQFTLSGDARHGNRPSFSSAAKPEIAEPMFNALVTRLNQMGVGTQTGRFRTHMSVSLVNDGPVTILLDSRRSF